MIYDCCNNMGNVESFDLTFKVQTNEHCLNIIFFLPFEKKDDKGKQVVCAGFYEKNDYTLECISNL